MATTTYRANIGNTDTTISSAACRIMYLHAYNPAAIETRFVHFWAGAATGTPLFSIRLGAGDSATIGVVPMTVAALHWKVTTGFDGTGNPSGTDTTLHVVLRI